MGRGMLYEVRDSARDLLAACRTKAEWYEAMGTLNLENGPQLDAEESLGFWASKLQSMHHPWSKFFVGDLRAEYDVFDDPNVCFIGGDSLRGFLSELEGLGKSFLADLFPHDGPYGAGESWLYDPLCTFLRGACGQGNAVIMLWEN